MKKLFLSLLVLTTGLLLTGCASKEDTAAVDEAYGRVMLQASASGIASDFYLSRVVSDEGVEFEWKSTNSAIEIVKETAKLQYDTEEYEYYKAKVTLPSGEAVTGKLEATLTKGKAERVWSENCRVVPRYTVESYDALAALAGDSYVLMTLEVEKIASVSSGVFSPTFKAADGSSVYAYKIPESFHGLCDEVGKKVTVYAQKGAYNGKAQLANVTLVVAA